MTKQKKDDILSIEFELRTWKYKGYKRVDDSGTLSSIIGGTKLINMTTISPLYLFPNDWGQLGTLEYEVYSPGKWNFDKDIIDIY